MSGLTKRVAKGITNTKSGIYKLSTITMPVELNHAIKLLAKAAGYGSMGRYLATVVREDAVKYADKMSAEEFALLIESLKRTDDIFVKQDKYNEKNKRNAWGNPIQGQKQSNPFRKYEKKEYL